MICLRRSRVLAASLLQLFAYGQAQMTLRDRMELRRVAAYSDIISVFILAFVAWLGSPDTPCLPHPD